jgi:hypothetical protein
VLGGVGCGEWGAEGGQNCFLQRVAGIRRGGMRRAARRGLARDLLITSRRRSSRLSRRRRPPLPPCALLVRAAGHCKSNYEGGCGAGGHNMIKSVGKKSKAYREFREVRQLSLSN